jgi:hypothetical protein
MELKLQLFKSKGAPVAIAEDAVCQQTAAENSLFQCRH